ncbi:hypothetical protein [Roseivivax sp. CAU 1761]
MAINLAVLVAFVVLATLQFHQVRSELERERLRIVAERAAEPLAAAAGIGLDLASVRNLPGILERSRQSDSAIIALSVIASDGAVMVSTLPEHGGDIGAATLRRLEEPGLPSSYREGGDYRYLITFRDSHETLVGALLTEYSGAAANTAVWAMAGRLATAALLLCILGSAVSAWSVKAVLRPEIAADRAIADADRDLERRLWRGQHDAAPHDSEIDITHALKDAENAYLRAREANS